ncbi:MAG: hypothetical protein IPL61_27230 [Myxococcales bacterium]|nr:hypothetical protein [Myxococcales bacterium]
MHAVRLTLCLSSLVLTAGACGSPDGGDTADAATAADGAIDGASAVDAPVEVDAPACLPALPSSLVLAATDPMPPTYTSLATLTSTGELAVLGYDGANGEAVRWWDGSQWMTSPVYGNTNGGFGRLALGELAGRAVVFGDVSDQSSDSDKLRYWMQLASGAFATGQRVGNVTAGEVRATRYDAATQVLSAAGGDQSHTLESYERNAAGTWTVAQVASRSTSGSLYAAGIGVLADGTAAIAGTGTDGFVLYRRTGLQWGPYRTLASGGIYAAQLAFPAAGATGTAAVAIYGDPQTNHPRGLFVDLATGAPTGAGDLIPQAIGISAVDSTIAFEPGTDRGKILLVDDNFNAPRAWIIGFEGTAFTAAQELRPDRVFETFPRLVYHPCGGYQVLHVSRAPTDAAGTAPLRFEPLATFAPGL